MHYSSYNFLKLMKKLKEINYEIYLEIAKGIYENKKEKNV